MAQKDPEAIPSYLAEDGIRALTYRSWYTLTQAQAWVNRFLRSAWALAQWPRRVLRRIGVKALRLRSLIAQADRDDIHLAPPALARPFVVLHELAHVVAIRAYRCFTHGARWRTVLLALVGRYVGKVAQAALVRAYKRRGLTTLSAEGGARPKKRTKRGG